jgi:hypothetical protein
MVSTTSTTLPTCAATPLAGAVCELDAIAPDTLCTSDSISAALVQFVTTKLGKARSLLMTAEAGIEAHKKRRAIVKIENKAAASVQQIVARLSHDVKRKKISADCEQAITELIMPLHDRILAARSENGV